MAPGCPSSVAASWLTPCAPQFNNTLLYCVPRILQVGARFQVRTRIDVSGLKVSPGWHRPLAGSAFPAICAAGLTLPGGSLAQALSQRV